MNLSLVLCTLKAGGDPNALCEVVLALDVKTTCRANCDKHDEPPPGLLSAYTHDLGRILAAIPCGKGVQEISALLETLKTLANTYGRLDFWVTADALHSIVKSMSGISKLGINFSLFLKRTDTKLTTGILKFAHDSDTDFHEVEVENDHGRDKTRSFSIYLPTPELLKFWEECFSRQNQAAPLGMIVHEISVVNGMTNYRYFILSK